MHVDEPEGGYRNPYPTVDVIIEIETEKGTGIVLIERQNTPHGWAIPGGFVDYGESLETAAVREAKEETTLDVTLVHQLHSYSDPDRDPRHHCITTVYIARSEGQPQGADDAKRAEVFSLDALPQPLVFDHARIIDDYRTFKATGAHPSIGDAVSTAS